MDGDCCVFREAKHELNRCGYTRPVLPSVVVPPLLLNTWGAVLSVTLVMGAPPDAGEPTATSPSTPAPTETTATEEAVPANTTAPTSDSAAAPKSDRLDRRSAPRHLRRRGIGLFIGTGASAFVGAVMTAARVGVVRNGDCQNVDTTTETYTEATQQCIREPLVYLGTSWVQLFSNGVAFGLAAGGGAVAGRHDAYWDYRRGRERRSPVGLIAGGASLMSLSIIAGTVVQLRMWGTAYGFTECGGVLGSDPSTVEIIPLEGCWENRWSGYVVATEVTQLGGVAGVGMLAYGASHRKNSRMLRALSGNDRRFQLRISPVTTPRWTGLSIAGRF